MCKHKYNVCVCVYAQDMHACTQMLFPPVAFNSLGKMSEATVLGSSISPKRSLYDFVAFSFYFSWNCSIQSFISKSLVNIFAMLSM